MYCIVLYCIVLYCIVLYCIVLHCIVLYWYVLYVLVCIVCIGIAKLQKHWSTAAAAVFKKRHLPTVSNLVRLHYFIDFKITEGRPQVEKMATLLINRVR